MRGFSMSYVCVHSISSLLWRSLAASGGAAYDGVGVSLSAAPSPPSVPFAELLLRGEWEDEEEVVRPYLGSRRRTLCSGWVGAMRCEGEGMGGDWGEEAEDGKMSVVEWRTDCRNKVDEGARSIAPIGATTCPCARCIGFSSLARGEVSCGAAVDGLFRSLGLGTSSRRIHAPSPMRSRTTGYSRAQVGLVLLFSAWRGTRA
ncbi:hypothetical protein R3P38DRAFT_410429 [Favolaschia claudopus]|uniref:Secreted protein n=1 Tax=Favolaschia claudopus TaxID=2862362 RepID=A0AAV9ZHM6_9AGAR